MKKKIIKITVMTLAMIISIGVGFIINTTDEETFKIVDNKDTYTGNNGSVYFAFFKDDGPTDLMPEKDSGYTLDLKESKCDKEATLKWDDKRWGPIIKNLKQKGTSCELHFKKDTSTITRVCEEQNLDIAVCTIANLAKSDTSTLAYDDTEDKNLRYIGNSPKNYVYFNCTDPNNTKTCEKWRIIGAMNNIEDSEGEKSVHLKIMRSESIQYSSSIKSLSWDS